MTRPAMHLPLESPPVPAADNDSAAAPDLLARYYPETAAGGFSDIDLTVAFYQRVQALLTPSMVVLDFGAGRGVGHQDDPVRYRRRLRDLRGEGRHVIGVDPDTAVFDNPSLDRAMLLDEHGRIPLGDETVDLIVSDFVFEHLPDPAHTAMELRRVLKPGGWLCLRTTSRHGYVALGNRLLGDRLGASLLARLQRRRRREDIFPAHYRCNTPGALRGVFPEAAFAHVAWHAAAEPSYHGDAALLFRLTQVLHAVLPPPCLPFLLAFLRKRP